MPCASFVILKVCLETDLNTALVSMSTMFCYHLSGPPRALRSEKNSSISIKNAVLRYSGSTSISALKRPISLISTSSSQYRMRKLLLTNAD